MKLYLIGVAALALVLPAAALAQIPSIPGTIELSVAGGASVPMGDFGDFASTGYGVGVNGSYFVTPAFGVGGTSHTAGDRGMLWLFAGLIVVLSLLGTLPIALPGH